jgi:hypothetical protein
MKRLKREAFMEFCYGMCHIFVVFIKVNEADSDVKYNIGWCVIGGCMGLISVYLLDGVQMTYNKAKNVFRKLQNSYMSKNKRTRYLIRLDSIAPDTNKKAKLGLERINLRLRNKKKVDF